MSNETNVSEEEINEIVPSAKVQFWTFLIFEIPSLICLIYLVYHLLTNKNLRQALNNHVIIILLFLCLIIEIIDIPLYLDAFLHNGTNSFHPSTNICLLWWLIDYGAYGAVIIMLTWASFERHILIFHHNRFLSTKRKRIIFHYIPLGLIAIYIIGFYIGVIIFPPCENTFDMDSLSCGSSPCYLEVTWLDMCDFMLNGVICTVIEAICSVGLLIRVIWQKHRVHQPILWRKHRKMTIQLLSISTLSLSIIFPQSLLAFIRKMIPGMDSFAAVSASYFFYLVSFVILLLPIVSLACLPELWRKFLIFKRRPRQTITVPFVAAPKRRIDLK
ncbi:unnamed protein product [Adineta ricciae]|uniref:Uncharacterized protein n=1 Tax=Adineta ricciae TaxID=249248 RepID=A0A815LBA0_ADIRI|nr:unnamed protein product [Adineta ricciae]